MSQRRGGCNRNRNRQTPLRLSTLAPRTNAVDFVTSIRRGGFIEGCDFSRIRVHHPEWLQHRVNRARQKHSKPRVGGVPSDEARVQ